jgi:hypothetical protein
VVRQPSTGPTALLDPAQQLKPLRPQVRRAGSTGCCFWIRLNGKAHLEDSFLPCLSHDTDPVAFLLQKYFLRTSLEPFKAP